MHLEFRSTFGATWPIWGLNFGAHWISEGRPAWRFSMYLALPQKIEKTNIGSNFTANVGETKYTEKRRADRPSCFGGDSILAATGSRSGDPLGVSRCIWC